MNRKQHYMIFGILAKNMKRAVKMPDDIEAFEKLRRLARKHHRLAEMDCNGVGVLRGKTYYAGSIDKWAREQYGNNVLPAYQHTDPDRSVFDVESDVLQGKILEIAHSFGFTVEFQGDPRGNTVKIYADNNKAQYVDLMI